jgi:hypothetical protein
MSYYFETRNALEPLPLTRDMNGISVRPEGRGYLTGVTDYGAPYGFNWELDYQWFEDTVWPRLASRVLLPLAPEPVRPFNVTRAASFPILTSTELVNYRYQALLAGTPWRYYRLVMTQWPRVEGNQAYGVSARLDGSVANTFPGLGAFSATANVTMETFDQSGPHLGCMSCHNSARMRADFMWTILDHAYPAQFGPATPASRPPPAP